jgi:hypothetical protein
MRNISFGRKNKASLFRKAKFSIYDDKHLIELIKDINGLIDDLYKLFPPPEEKQVKLGKEELDKLTAVLHKLEEVVRDRDLTLASAVQQILNQKVSEGCRAHSNTCSHMLERYENRQQRKYSSVSGCYDGWQERTKCE